MKIQQSYQLIQNVGQKVEILTDTELQSLRAAKKQRI